MSSLNQLQRKHVYIKMIILKIKNNSKKFRKTLTIYSNYPFDRQTLL